MEPSARLPAGGKKKKLRRRGGGVLIPGIVHLIGNLHMGALNRPIRNWISFFFFLRGETSRGCTGVHFFPPFCVEFSAPTPVETFMFVRLARFLCRKAKCLNFLHPTQTFVASHDLEVDEVVASRDTVFCPGGGFNSAEVLSFSQIDLIFALA